MKTIDDACRRCGVFLLLGVLVLCQAGPVVAASNSGSEWDIKTTIVTPGMPAVPPTISRMCLEDKGIPYQARGEEKCETIYKVVSGNSVSWKIVCDNNGRQMEMTGETSYTGSTMKSDVKMKSRQGNTVDISGSMTGQKVGPCK